MTFISYFTIYITVFMPHILSCKQFWDPKYVALQFNVPTLCGWVLAWWWLYVVETSCQLTYWQYIDVFWLILILNNFRLGLGNTINYFGRM